MGKVEVSVKKGLEINYKVESEQRRKVDKRTEYIALPTKRKVNN